MGDNMGKHIQLYTTNGSWVAAFMDDWGNPDKEIVALFGTHHLPTAYTSQAAFETVKNALSALNPGYHVSLS